MKNKTSEPMARITPTMHYTSFIWYKNSLSTSRLVTSNGRMLYKLLRPFDKFYHYALKRPGLESMLLQRHQTIDEIVEQAIRLEGYEQVIELAAGLSARSLRFSKIFPKVTFFDTDLAQAIELKRKLLKETASNHHLQDLDILQQQELKKFMGHLKRDKKTLIISEGIIGYLSHKQVQTLWQNLSTFLSSFPAGLYISDYRLEELQEDSKSSLFFKKALGLFVKGKISFSYKFEKDLTLALQQKNFSEVKIYGQNPKIKTKVLCAKVKK